MKHRTVLGDDRIDEPKIAGHASQIAQDSPGHEDCDDAPVAEFGQDRPHVRIEGASLRDGPVVVDGDDRESHAVVSAGVSARSVKTGHEAARITCSVVDPNKRLSTASRP